MLANKIYILSSLVSSVLLVMLMFTIVIFFAFKEKMYYLRREIAKIERQIHDKSNKTMMLESDYALKSNSTRIKPLADQHLKAHFTNVKQLLQLQDIPLNNKASARVAYN